jgi:predicted hydrocarbon binding protein
VSGRIGRLARKIEEHSGREVAEEVLPPEQNYRAAGSAGRADWIRQAVTGLEKAAGRNRARRIMESCGRMCCRTASRRAAELAKKTRSLRDLVAALNRAGIGGGRLRLKDAHTITGGYDRCYCGQVSRTRTPFPSLTYCHCSAGWYRQLFETALGHSVTVRVVKSIVHGDDQCEFLIRV